MAIVFLMISTIPVDKFKLERAKRNTPCASVAAII